MCKILLLLTEKSNWVWVAKRYVFSGQRAIHASTPFPSPPEVCETFNCSSMCLWCPPGVSVGPDFFIFSVGIVVGIAR